MSKQNVNNNMNNGQNQPRSFKIFLGSLPPKTTKSLVRKTFGEYGKIKAIYLQFNKKNNFCKGSGYIVLAKEQAYQKILEENITILGRKIFKEPFLRGRKLKKKKKDFSSKRIFITDIPVDMSDKELKEIFTRFGKVEQAYRITCCNGSKQPYGFVLYKDSSSALKCHKISKVKVQDVVLSCRLFENKEGKEGPAGEYVPKKGKKVMKANCKGNINGENSRKKTNTGPSNSPKIPRKFMKFSPKCSNSSGFENSFEYKPQKLRRFCSSNLQDRVGGHNIPQQAASEEEAYKYPKIDPEEYLSKKLRAQIEKNHEEKNLKMNHEENLFQRFSILKGRSEYHHGRRMFF